MLRDLVFPRVLEYFVDIFKWINSCFLNVEVLLCGAKLDQYSYENDSHYNKLGNYY